MYTSHGRGASSSYSGSVERRPIQNSPQRLELTIRDTPCMRTVADQWYIDDGDVLCHRCWYCLIYGRSTQPAVNFGAERNPQNTEVIFVCQTWMQPRQSGESMMFTCWPLVPQQLAEVPRSEWQWDPPPNSPPLPPSPHPLPPTRRTTQQPQEDFRKKVSGAFNLEAWKSSSERTIRDMLNKKTEAWQTIATWMMSTSFVTQYLCCPTYKRSTRPTLKLVQSETNRKPKSSATSQTWTQLLLIGKSTTFAL